MYAIEVENLSKQFGKQVVLKDISLQLETRKIHGLIGDNGSGKSVLLKCLCGILPWDHGLVKILGKVLHPGSAKQPVMGIVIEHPSFLGSMSGWRNLKYLAGIRGIASNGQIEEALRAVGLANDAKKQVKRYSLGMRQKLAIAQAIMEKPQIFIMDEPFNGLDKASAAAMRNLFLSLKEQGCTFLLVSHHEADIAQLCDDVYSIENGSIILHSSRLSRKEDCPGKAST